MSKDRVKASAGFNQKLADFTKNVAEGTIRIFVLARSLTIGPTHMTGFATHTAYNAAAYSIAAILVLVTVNYMSPGGPIGLSVSILASAMSIIFFSVLGFLVNLATPNPKRLENTELQDDAVSIANKWATYAVFCFFLSLAIYAILYKIMEAIFHDDVFTYCYISELSTPCIVLSIFTGRVEFGIVFVSAAIGTGAVYAACFSARRVLDKMSVVACLFVTTIAIISAMMYLLLFKVFV